jgi:pyrimidine-specific ribonucleoside hydrolase
MSKHFFFFLLLLTPILVFSQQSSKPVPVIFDTDMGPDYDDVGAITLLHSFADSGKATILATVASTGYEGVAAVLSTLNTYFNKPSIPVGVPKGKAVMLRDEQHWSDTLIANYPHRINRNDETQNSIDLYRKILADQPDTSVTIITVGFLTNIADLLKSPADSYSPLTGKELVKRKVKKLVSMAGKFPSGKEFNIEEDAASAKFAFENFPRPVVLSGFEIGEKIKTGLPLINNSSIQNSPVKDVFRISINMREEDKDGRMSWDQTAVLVGINGHEPYYTLEYGTISVDDQGANSWSTQGRRHARLIAKSPPSEVQNLINTMMMHQPLVTGK